MKKPVNYTQRGFALIEALVSIVILSLGILGILGVQMRTLADTQNGVRRAQAIRLIENLSEKIKVNPNPLLASVLSAYRVSTPGPISIPSSCTTACTPVQLAQHDIATWKLQVINTLPAGDAVVFFVDDETDANNRRQLGVMISWQQKEKDTSAAFSAPFTTSSTGSTSNVTCPANKTCHLQYIQVTGRCQQDNLGGPSSPKTWCPFSKSELP